MKLSSIAARFRKISIDTRVMLLVLAACSLVLAAFTSVAFLVDAAARS